MQDYKSLCASVTICATLVNIQTHTQTESILASLYDGHLINKLQNGTIPLISEIEKSLIYVL